jgi:hypothetical protein
VRLKRGTPPRLVFTSDECNLLTEVLQAVKDEITGSDATDPVIERLFPAAYEDAGDASAFRDLTEDDLRESRVLRLVDCTEELGGQDGQIPLTPQAADRWIRVLNDARLVLGTRLEVTEEWDHALDPDDPEVAEKAVYVWLSAVQETVVQSLMSH